MKVVVLLYVATEHARRYLIDRSETVWGKDVCSVEIVQLIPEHFRLKDEATDPFCSLLKDYYDHTVFDKHFENGGGDTARFGYAGGALPLVLHHNTPNNSIALLWSYEDRAVCGLFPRVQRHKETS